MNSQTRRFIAFVGIGLGMIMPLNRGFADSQSFKQLSAEWWQWVLSIPPSENPILDETGEKCMVGQRDSFWFLAGNFGEGSTARACAVPEGRALFFPVINSVNIDTPNVCGQGIDGATNLVVDVDGEPVKTLDRV
jgi:hypothetical protein